jgi:hypothetical protein
MCPVVADFMLSMRTGAPDDLPGLTATSPDLYTGCRAPIPSHLKHQWPYWVNSFSS